MLLLLQQHVYAPMPFLESNSGDGEGAPQARAFGLVLARQCIEPLGDLAEPCTPPLCWFELVVLATAVIVLLLSE